MIAPPPFQDWTYSGDGSEWPTLDRWHQPNYTTATTPAILIYDREARLYLLYIYGGSPVFGYPKLLGTIESLDPQQVWVEYTTYLLTDELPPQPPQEP